MMSEGSTLPDAPGRTVTEKPPHLFALEHAMQALALARLAGGMAHDVKNPLNAMALQLALLVDKIASGGDDLAAACAGNLASIRNQIVRIDELVRRFADLADPGDGSRSLDLGQLACDVAALFGHEARRRGATIACDATPGIVTARVDAARAARIVLGLACRSLSGAGEGARVALRAAVQGEEAVLTLDQSGRAEPSLAWIAAVAEESVRDMGGRCSRAELDAGERVELRFEKESAS